MSDEPVIETDQSYEPPILHIVGGTADLTLTSGSVTDRSL